MTKHRWSVLLAGGEGTRLKGVTRSISGDERPKQFCHLLGDGSLLQQTRARVASTVPWDQSALVLLKAHERYYHSEVSGVPSEHLFIQSSNRGTTVAVTFSLMRLLQLDREAVVGFFPTDHYYGDDDVFSAVLNRAYEEAGTYSDRVIVLGAQPDHAEREYGWIEPGGVLSPAGTSSSVRRFVEKPDPVVAERLLQQGCLWNTFVMVGRLEAFLDLLRWTVPETVEHLGPVAYFSGTPSRRLERLYDTIAPGDFSHQVLAQAPEHLAVLRMGMDCAWTDLGTPARFFDMLRKTGGTVPADTYALAEAALPGW